MSSPFLEGGHFHPPGQEILKLMDAVVTGDEVKRGKPQRLGEESDQPWSDGLPWGELWENHRKMVV